MKPVGRSPKPFTEKDIQMIKEYLETDKSLLEVATKYGISGEGLRYKVKKYCKEQKIFYGEFEGEVFELPPLMTVAFLLSDDGKQVLLVKQGDAIGGIMQEHTDLMIEAGQYAADAVKRKTEIEMTFVPPHQKDNSSTIYNCLYWAMDGSGPKKYFGLEVYAAKVKKEDVPLSDDMVWMDIDEMEKLLICRCIPAIDDINILAYVSMARSVLNLR